MNAHKPKRSDFYRFIYDRQKIWVKKEVKKLPAPWTNDKTLATFKFCNVYRELDTCTKHLIENVHKSKVLDLEGKIFNTILYRRFNTSHFFKDFGLQNWKDFKWKSLIKTMDYFQSQGENLFNSAYIISQTPYDRKFGRRDKHVQQVLVLRDIAPRMDELAETLLASDYQQAFNFLTEIYGHGGFLAQQVLIDLSYLPEFKHWNVNSFVQVGPGAVGGLDLLFPYGEKKQFFYANACKVLYLDQAKMFTYLEKVYDIRWDMVRYKSAIAGGKYLRLSDIQNCLCEFRKYCHLQTNPNKRKRYYNG